MEGDGSPITRRRRHDDSTRRPCRWLKEGSEVMAGPDLAGTTDTRCATRLPVSLWCRRATTPTTGGPIWRLPRRPTPGGSATGPFGVGAFAQGGPKWNMAVRASCRVPAEGSHRARQLQPAAGAQHPLGRQLPRPPRSCRSAAGRRRGRALNLNLLGADQVGSLIGAGWASGSLHPRQRSSGRRAHFRPHWKNQRRCQRVDAWGYTGRASACLQGD